MAPSFETFVGVDGCRAGWVGVAIHRSGELRYLVAPRFSDLAARFPDALMLVDVPIGLRGAGRDERSCDLAARGVLGKRRTSVFPAPARPALNAPDYQTACSRNAAATAGRRLSQQSYAILGKIREVDDYLRSGTATGVIREMHPEVCFWGLNECRPLCFPKKSPQGYDERTRLLSPHLSDLSGFVAQVMREHPRRDLGRDDLVDALVGAVSGFLAGGDLLTLPERPEVDEYDLPMEMVYARPTLPRDILRQPIRLPATVPPSVPTSETVAEQDIESRVRSAVTAFLARDLALLHSGAGERAVVAKLACHLASQFESYDVDVEYNRHGLEPKKLDRPAYCRGGGRRRIFPDIIVHRRGNDDSNLLAIEVKKSANREPRCCDIAKLTAMKAEYGYKRGLLLDFPRLSDVPVGTPAEHWV